MHRLLLTAGRSRTGLNVDVADLNDETLLCAAKQFLPQIDNLRSMSTQILIWEDSGLVHNLVGAVDVSTMRLKTL